MNEMKKGEQTEQNLSGKTVLFVFGTVALILTITWWLVGGWYMALTIPASILVCLGVIILFRLIWNVIFATLFFPGLGIVRLFRAIRTHATRR